MEVFGIGFLGNDLKDFVVILDKFLLKEVDDWEDVVEFLMLIILVV